MQDNITKTCGCGCRESITSTKPNAKYILGHNNRRTPNDYEVVDMSYKTPCWAWIRSINPKGYGRATFASGKTGLAHRKYYENHIGPIAKGMQIDHLCRVTRCVNPEHMEQVTPAENIRRACRTKLNWDSARELRRRIAAGERTIDLARAFEIGTAHVRAMVTDKTLWVEGETA